MAFIKLTKHLAVGIIFFLTACTSEQVQPSIDCTTSPIVISIVEVTPSSCGLADGAFSLEASGGEAPYSFQSDLGTNSTGNYENVPAGTYDVTVTDAKGCTESVSISVQNEEGVNIDNLTSTDAGCGTSNGQIEVIVSGGNEPYAFSLNNAAPQSTSVFTGLESGSYQVSVTDGSGCETSQSVDILSGTSYQSSVKSIIENNCAISGCHNGSIAPDLRTFNAIQSNASRIKSRTGNRSMPRGRTLTQTQIDLIACWVDDGAPNN